MKKFILFAMSSLYALFADASLLEQDYARYDQLKKYTNILTDLIVIDYYQRMNPSPYAVLDKKTKTLYVFNERAERLATEKVRTYAGDELDRGGSGIYTYMGQQNDVHYGRAEKDKSIHGLFQGRGPLIKGTVLYVISETTAHRFRIRNRTITFNSRDVIRNLPEYNYSPRNLKVFDTTFRTDRTDSFSQRYVHALEKEKARLMDIYELENDEYNMLAEFAYGVLAPETEFGRNWRYHLKEFAPYATSLLKGNGLDTSENSRGPTQIKDIPQAIVENYGLQKHQLKIPENAAIATLGKAAELLTEIRTRARKGQHGGLNEETLQNYMYYLYNGLHREIINNTATPNFNIKIQQIKEAMKGFHIEERF